MLKLPWLNEFIFSKKYGFTYAYGGYGATVPPNTTVKIEFIYPQEYVAIWHDNRLVVDELDKLEISWYADGRLEIGPQIIGETELDIPMPRPVIVTTVGMAYSKNLDTKRYHSWKVLSIGQWISKDTYRQLFQEIEKLLAGT